MFAEPLSAPRHSGPPRSRRRTLPPRPALLGSRTHTRFGPFRGGEGAEAGPESLKASASTGVAGNGECGVHSVGSECSAIRGRGLLGASQLRESVGLGRLCQSTGELCPSTSTGRAQEFWDSHHLATGRGAHVKRWRAAAAWQIITGGVELQLARESSSTPPGNRLHAEPLSVTTAAVLRG